MDNALTAACAWLLLLHSPFLKKTIQQNEKQVADNNRKAAVRAAVLITF